MTPTEEPTLPLKKVSDPIDANTMKEFARLRRTRQSLALRLLELEEERFAISEASRDIETQKIHLFEKVLIERGLPPNTPAEIDAKVGRLRISKRPPAQATPSGDDFSEGEEG